MHDIYSYLQSEKAEAELIQLTSRLRLSLIVSSEPGSDYKQSPLRITETNWRELIDPELPTIGIRADVSLFDAALYAQASQQLRYGGEAMFNVVILPSSVYGKESETDNAHFAEKGIVIDRKGRFYYGDFPEALQIDVMNGYGLAADQEYLFDFINTPEQEAVLDDKERTKEAWLQDIAHTETLAIWSQGDDIEALVDLYREHKRIVLKPFGGFGGLGVSLFDLAEVDEAAFRQILTDHYDEQEAILVERWQEGLPIEHPDSGALLSADIRAIAVKDRLVGMYARVGTAGTPANLASQAWTIEETYGQAGPEVRQRVGAQTVAFATAAGANFLGSSTIVSPELESVVMEGDGERSGGIRHITELEKPADPLALYKTVVRAWHESFGGSARIAPNRAAGDQLGRTVFFPEDATRELFSHARNVSSMADVAFFRNIVAGVSSAEYDGERLHPALLELVEKAPQVVTPSEFVASMHPTVVETIRLGRVAMDVGNLEAAVDQLNRAAEREWDIPTTQKKIANVLIIETDEASQHTALISDYASEAVAQAYARTLYTHALTQTGLDHLGISRPTARLIQETLTTYLLAPSGNRSNLARILAVQSLSFFPKEAVFIAPLLDRLGQLDGAAYSAWQIK